MPVYDEQHPDDPLLTSAEAAERIGYSNPSSWRYLVKLRGIEADARPDGRTPLYRASTVDEAGASRHRGRRTDLRRQSDQ